MNAGWVDRRVSPELAVKDGSDPLVDAARSSESGVPPESLGSFRACISTLHGTAVASAVGPGWSVICSRSPLAFCAAYEETESVKKQQRGLKTTGKGLGQD